MATTAEIQAAIAKAEKAGRMDLADKLRARLSEASDAAPSAAPSTTPDTARITAAIAKAEAAGRADLAEKLRAALPATPVDMSVATPSKADPVPGSPEAKQAQIDEFTLFEMANPKLRGKFTPETLPKPGETIPGANARERVTVQPWRNVKTDTFWDTAAAVMEGPVAAMGAFGAGITGSGPSPSRGYIDNDPFLGQMPGPVKAGLSKVGDVGGAALSTVGAGLAGAIGLGSELVPGQGVQDEKKLAEDLTGMTMFAAPELAGASSLIGKSATVSGKIKVPQIGTKTWRNAFGASEAKPTIESLLAAKNEAYKAVDEAGEVFEAPEMAALRDKVKADLDAGNYVSGVDKQTDAVVTLLDRKAGESMSLGQLDKLRQEFYKRLSAAPNEVGIEDAIDAIDEMIAGRGDTSDLMTAARLSNARYKKAEMLDLAFQKAKNQTNATGSGGNILNKMKQAVGSIVDNPKRARWFNKDELETMTQFIEGSSGQRAMRLFGKLSPNGNGLMMALNLGGAAQFGGTSLLVTGAASAAKALADRSAIRGGDALIGKMGGGAAKAATKPQAKSVSVPIPMAPTAGQGATSDYEALWRRYGG